MISKAWIILPHTVFKGDNGIELQNEILPLVMCCDCKYYDLEKKWCPHMKVANSGEWFCADGEKR